eukprot:282493-Chlamydomonas_euryale.AAC.6
MCVRGRGTDGKGPRCAQEPSIQASSPPPNARTPHPSLEPNFQARRARGTQPRAAVCARGRKRMLSRVAASAMCLRHLRLPCGWCSAPLCPSPLPHRGPASTTAQLNQSSCGRDASAGRPRVAGASNPANPRAQTRQKRVCRGSGLAAGPRDPFRAGP